MLVVEGVLPQVALEIVVFEEVDDAVRQRSEEILLAATLNEC